MGATFDSIDDRITAASYSSPAVAGTIALRIKPAWNSGDSADHVFFTIGESSDHNLKYQKYSDNNIYIGWSQAGNDNRIIAADTGIFTSGTWKSHILTWDDPANVETFYVDGAMIANRTAGLFTGTSGTGDYSIGNYEVIFGGGPVNCNSDIAEFAEWSAILSTDERAAYDKGFSPLLIRPTNLRVYLPLVRAFNDIKGMTFTASNIAAAVHPRVIYPKRRTGRTA